MVESGNSAMVIDLPPEVTKVLVRAVIPRAPMELSVHPCGGAGSVVVVAGVGGASILSPVPNECDVVGGGADEELQPASTRAAAPSTTHFFSTVLTVRYFERPSLTSVACHLRLLSVLGWALRGLAVVQHQAHSAHHLVEAPLG